MSDFNPENYAEFTTSDGPESPGICDEEQERVETVATMLDDPESLILEASRTPAGGPGSR